MTLPGPLYSCPHDAGLASVYLFPVTSSSQLGKISLCVGNSKTNLVLWTFARFPVAMSLFVVANVMLM